MEEFFPDEFKRDFFLGVVGSRSRNEESDYDIVEKLILDFYVTHKRKLILVSGGCAIGADNFAERVAKKYGIPILIFYPDLLKLREINEGDFRQRYRIVAYDRNIEIAKKSKTLIAIVSNERKGGTEHTIKQFKKYNKGQEIIIR